MWEFCPPRNSIFYSLDLLICFSMFWISLRGSILIHFLPCEFCFTGFDFYTFFVVVSFDCKDTVHWCVDIYYVSHNFFRIRLTPWWSYVTLSFKSFLGVKAYLHWGYHRCWCVISTGGHDIVLYYICDQYMYLLICDFITLFCFSWPRKGAFFLSILNQLGFIYVGDYVFFHYVDLRQTIGLPTNCFCSLPSVFLAEGWPVMYVIVF